MNAKRPARSAFELCFALAALSTTLPLFAGHYLPLQDLPQHVAAIRVLHDYGKDALGFQQFYEISLSSTQYLSVYLVAHWLAFVTGTLLATKLVLGAALVALPYAIRALLRALGRPESLSLLSLPLAYNAHLVLGFLNFVAALPLLFWGLALAVRVRSESALRARFGLALVTLVCFYTHIVPYGMLVAGTLLIGAGDTVRSSLLRALPLAPSLVAAAAWLGVSPAGALLTALARGQSRETLEFGRSFGDALREAPLWLTDVFWSGGGLHVLIGWSLLVLFVILVRKSRWLDAAMSRFVVGKTLMLGTADHAEARVCMVRRLRLLVLLACLGYLTLPESYAFMWPIHARFPLLALLCAIPVLPIQSASLRFVTGLACFGLIGQSTLGAWQAFRSAGEREYAGLSQLIARIPEGSRVAGLIFSPTSNYLKFSPYLHAVAWVQAERGGAVMFSFADFPASPFRFREQNRPPRVAPRWEWMPERVDSVRDLAFFDYALTRSGPLRLAGFEPLFRSGGWSLFKRP